MYSRVGRGGVILSTFFSFLFFRPFFCLTHHKQKKRSSFLCYVVSSPLCLSLSFFVFFSLSTRGRERNKFMGVFWR